MTDGSVPSSIHGGIDTIGGNLPPGCKVTDIPGNRPEDIAWMKFIEESDVPRKLYKEYFGEEPESYVDIYNSMDDDNQFQRKVNKEFNKGMRERPYPPDDPIKPGESFREKHEFRRPSPDKED